MHIQSKIHTASLGPFPYTLPHLSLSTTVTCAMTFTPPSNTTPPQSSSYVSIDSPTDRCALSSSILGCSFLEHPDGGFEPYIAIQSPSTSESTLKRTGWSPGRFIMTPVRASDAEAQVEKNVSGPRMQQMTNEDSSRD